MSRSPCGGWWGYPGKNWGKSGLREGMDKFLGATGRFRRHGQSGIQLRKTAETRCAIQASSICLKRNTPAIVLAGRIVKAGVRRPACLLASMIAGQQASTLFHTDTPRFARAPFSEVPAPSGRTAPRCLCRKVRAVETLQIGKRRDRYRRLRIASSRACTSSQAGIGPKHRIRHCFSNSKARIVRNSGGGKSASLCAKVMPGGGV